MAVTLTPQEARVLGVLIEKSLALPEYYPMTINAVTAACNQKNNRNPVTHYTEADVATALHGLTRWQLAAQAPPDRNSRVNRFCHEVEPRFGWTTPQRAIMAELFIRGPQTVGELRTNASRMFKLDSLDYVNELLTALQSCDPPFAAVLPRQPGQSTIRYGHLLCGEVTSIESTPGQINVSHTGNEGRTPVPHDIKSISSTTEMTVTQTRLANLELQVASLKSQVADLFRRLDNMIVQ